MGSPISLLEEVLALWSIRETVMALSRHTRNQVSGVSRLPTPLMPVTITTTETLTSLAQTQILRELLSP